MIVAKLKSVKQVTDMVAAYDKILVAGCGTCVTVCYAGGEREAAILASAIRMRRRIEGKNVQTEVRSIERQCEWEYLNELKDEIEAADAVISIACAAGIQAMGERYPDKPIFPGVDTLFIGIPQQQAYWTEKCIGCGDCNIGRFGGLCAVTRCAKGLVNGPCLGARDGKCEVRPELECIWTAIYNRLKGQNRLDELKQYLPPLDRGKGPDASPREYVREDMKL